MTQQKSLLDHLATRRSPPIARLAGSVPDDDIRTMLSLAARVPDHGSMEPFRFILYRGDARHAVGERLADRLAQRDGELSEAARQKERERFSRAPLVVGVVFTPKTGGAKAIPEWEQYLSAGSAAMNLLHAAAALGYGANWITNWYSEDAGARRLLGIGRDERVAGFVHIGRFDGELADRPRPDVAAITTEYDGPASED